MDEKNVTPGSKQGTGQVSDPSEDLNRLFTPESDAGKVLPDSDGREDGQENLEDADGQGKQEVLTEAKISELVDKRAEEIVNKALSRFQSLSDKSEKRFKEELQRTEKRLEALGKKLTPEEKVVLEGNLREEIRSSSDGDGIEGDEAKNSQNVPQPSEESVRLFATKVEELELEYGTRLFKEDAEWKAIEANPTAAGDSLALLEKIRIALKTKAARTNSDNSDSGARNRLPTITPTHKASDLKNLSPQELLNKAYPKPE